MALTFVQAAAVKGATVSTLAKAYTSNTTGSSYLLAWVLINPTTTTLTNITDTLGNTWVPIAAQTPENIYVYECRINNVAGGANTVTANFSTNASFCQLLIAEYTGQITSGSPAESCSAFKDATGASFTGNTVATTFTNETIVGIGFWNGTGVLTPTGGYTQRLSDAAGFFYLLDIAKAATGTYSPTISSDNAGTRFIQNTVALKSTTSVGNTSPISWTNRQRRFVNKR